MEFISVEIPGHFRTNIPLHSRNVLVLLEYGWRKIKRKDMSSLCIHISLYFTVIAIDAIVTFGAN